MPIFTARPGLVEYIMTGLVRLNGQIRTFPVSIYWTA